MNSVYEIYNASAGSGKTFTLTSRYLVKFLGSSKPETYRTILALTFTNKASEEMKNRILSSLKEFSSTKAIESPSEMLKAVKDQLRISIKEIHNRAKKRLNILLHNYSFFNVSTLDSFSHNIIRSFAKELKIVSDFQLILDSEQFINESIERLLDLVGKNKEITKALIDFANYKISEGKSWDITYDLKELSSLLTNENHYEKIKSLESKTMKDFLFAKEKIFNIIKVLELEIANQTHLSEETIKTTKMEIVFSRNSFPIFLEKLKRKDFKKINLVTTRNLFVKNTLITKKCSNTNEQSAVELRDKLFVLFEKVEKNLNKRSVLKAFQDSIVPISVLNQIKKISKKIQNENGELLISEFNKIISEEIKDQPAPYIFEKTGNKYKHYLIDEFQDTSMLQWANLIPLVSHSIESAENENDMGSLLLVGDPKQSLYRWRGANPDKFISLLDKENPFSVINTNKILPKNYRSREEIVRFNNLLFKHISKTFHFKDNQEVYNKGCCQNLNEKKGGFVSLDFLEKHVDKKLNEELFLKKTLDVICDCKKRGFLYSDQSVLVRNKNQQKLIADYLIKNEVPVISAEALMIKNSKKVSLLIELIRLRNEPDNLMSRKIIINYIIKKENPEDIFCFYQELLLQKIDKFFQNITEISYQDFVAMPVYDAIALINRKFNFDSEQDSHTQFFMDELFDYFLSGSRNEKQFLDFWDINKEKLNVVMSGEQNAVQVLTIHKSKGLEFPIVIYPFADSLTHRARNQKVWLPFDPEENRLELLIPCNKTIESAGQKGINLYNKIQREEELDNTNVLYVALTRAINEMYIVATLPKKASLSSHNEALRSFLESSGLWENSKKSYCWGKRNERYFSKNSKSISQSNVKAKLSKVVFIPQFKDVYKDNQLVFGNLFHKLMSNIEYSFQLEKEINLFLKTKNVKKSVLTEIIELAQKTVKNQKLAGYFTKKYKAICEKEIFTKEKEVVIPDRIVVSDIENYTIIEYKTGEKRKEHLLQLSKYAKTLRDMGLNVEKSILVYVTTSIEVVEL